MPLLDLVTPWASALAADDPLSATQHFRERHATMLARMAWHRAPHAETLPLAESDEALARAASRAGDPMLLQQLRDAGHDAAALGADLSCTTVLLAGQGEGETLLSLPGDPPLVALFLDGLPDNTHLQLAALRGQATLTRWLAPDSESVVRPHAALTSWDLWDVARTVPLREWIYTVGVAAHLAHAVVPTSEPHELFELRRGEWGRLRERERVLRALLDKDLDECGLGLLLRWLVRDTPPSVRTVEGTTIPPGAGAYLGWRLTADRVARVGIRDALRSAA